MNAQDQAAARAERDRNRADEEDQHWRNVAQRQEAAEAAEQARRDAMGPADGIAAANRARLF